ncbi:glycosyltransferase family 2 protein [Zunongwangia sp. F363]|uniref:Glycosyltransferase family 2 protein n=1 Tax=Autumnicola tepida TaxID=3075595 RepID=A0ABU3CAH7_9FLAO|nr:glycosyltransferase family 2 protein [Zunongwangia sp. F363]MDT0643045.1 glycosyltransferase family 2 protein [Zunongwangia sp. F363]
MVIPTTTIIMATYNRAHLILESLDSISKQSFKNWECLIVDDGSTDDTEVVVRDFVKRDPRFSYLKRPDNHLKGLPGCRNYGLEMAKGDNIIFFDDDDVVNPQNLEVCLKLLENTNADFCHYKKLSFTTKHPQFPKVELPTTTFSIGLSNIEKVVTNELALASCTVMWRKKCFGNIRFNESLNYAEEWECYTGILLEGYKGIGIDEVLYYNRKHPLSNTGEFWDGDKKRRKSHEKAIQLVIDNLLKKGLLSRKLIRYFVQMSIFHKNKEILEYLLLKSDEGITMELKYRMLYKFYPVFVQGHRFKKFLKQKS